jgi:hypothetical protein
MIDSHIQPLQTFLPMFQTANELSSFCCVRDDFIGHGSGALKRTSGSLAESTASQLRGPISSEDLHS